MKPRSRGRRLLLALVFLTAGAVAAAVVYADDLVRLSRNLPGESHPIVIDADEIITWVEGDTRVLLLKGQVLVQHDVVRAQLAAGVIFVDQKRYQATGVLDADVYGEGGTTVQNGSDVSSGATAFLDLHTRGELKLNAHKGKVLQESRAADPVYRRGVARRAAITAPPPPDAIQRTALTTPAAPVQDTPPAPPVLPPPPPPPPGGTAAPGPAAPGAGPPGSLLGGPLGAPAPGAPAPIRQFSIVPRNPSGFHIAPPERTPDAPAGRPGETTLIVTGGFILTVRSVDPRTGTAELLDIEADRGVIWTRGETRDQTERLQTSEGLTGRELEFYLAGHVEIRQRSGRDERTLRADEIYYDVSRNVALALSADLEFRQPGVADLIHVKADELQQLSQTQFRMIRGEFFSSKLPSDPGLKIVFAEGTLEERRRFRRTVFGREIINLQTDQPAVEVQKLVRTEDVFLRIEDVPVFYLPFLQGDANDPLGPIQDIRTGYNRIYGFQFGLTFNVFDLLGIDRVPNTRWRLDADYMSARGPALGSTFDFAGKDPFGVSSRYSGQLKGWMVYDTGTDDLGGGRTGQPHPNFRDWLDAKARIDDLPFGFSAQIQGVQFSDQNVWEQFDKQDFDTNPNKETFLYVKQQPEHENWAWTFLTQQRTNDWVTETNWLPRADGYLIGESLLDLFSYDAHASLGYGQQRPPQLSPFQVFPTQAVAVETGRADLMQELRLPFYLGPVKVVPYATLDLAYYTADLEDQSQGRVYGGGGVMASIPFTRLYPDVRSLLWNVNEINHKIVLSGNYYVAGASEPYTRFPQLDPLNDQNTEFTLNDIKPLEPLYNPVHGAALAASPVYDPQIYAIRQLLLNKVDTLDQMQELQLDLRQRWQTKRGFPGQEHIVDWMTLDLSGSVFPAPNRDNFGSTFGFLQYDWTWNIGDRTALASTGWVDPETGGPHVFTFGAYLNRTDRTNLFLGYRQIDPLESKAVTAAVTYVFSPKYAMTASSTYDFGTSQALSNSLVLTRMGSDVQLSLGITYNALTNNFGVTFEIVPNLVGNRRVPGLGPGLLQR